jgi:hypothetical protein
MRRKPGTSSEEFTAYWRDNHAPIVRDRPEVKGALAAEKYTHYRTLPDDPLAAEMIAVRGFGTASYDGICIPESGSVSMEDYASALADEDGGAIRAWQTLLEDEVNFMDMTTSIPCFATEETLLPARGDSPSTHVMVCYRRADGVSFDKLVDFKRNLFADHVAKLREDLGLAGHRLVVPIDTPLIEHFCTVRGCIDRPFDVMEVFSFESRADLERSWKTARAAWDELIQVETEMVSFEGSTLVVAESAVIFDDQVGR